MQEIIFSTLSGSLKCHGSKKGLSNIQIVFVFHPQYIGVDDKELRETSARTISFEKKVELLVFRATHAKVPLTSFIGDQRFQQWTLRVRLYYV